MLIFVFTFAAKYIKPDEQKPVCFRFKKRKIPQVLQRRRVIRKLSNRKLNASQVEKEKIRLQKNLAKKLKKMEKLKIDHELQIINT